jgi:uncharacterized protein HemY
MWVFLILLAALGLGLTSHRRTGSDMRVLLVLAAVMVALVAVEGNML